MNPFAKAMNGMTGTLSKELELSLTWFQNPQIPVTIGCANDKDRGKEYVIEWIVQLDSQDSELQGMYIYETID